LNETELMMKYLSLIDDDSDIYINALKVLSVVTAKFDIDASYLHSEFFLALECWKRILNIASQLLYQKFNHEIYDVHVSKESDDWKWWVDTNKRSLSQPLENLLLRNKIFTVNTNNVNMDVVEVTEVESSSARKRPQIDTKARTQEKRTKLNIVMDEEKFLQSKFEKQLANYLNT